MAPRATRSQKMMRKHLEGRRAIAFDLGDSAGVNPSERYLSRLCRHSFLRLWAHSNLFTDEDLREGRGSARELCDTLVVFGEDVLIFSDKHIEFQLDKPLDVAWGRWYRRAVQGSVRQLTGAASWIERFPQRVFLDPKCERPLPVALPPAGKARMHLIAVTRGTKVAVAKTVGADELPSLQLLTEELGDALPPFTVGTPRAKERLVHVFDEVSIEVLLRELDTAADFIAYLKRREEFLGNAGRRVAAAGEEQLLAAYLSNFDSGTGQRYFVDNATAAGADFVMFDGSLYAGLTKKPEYRAKKGADQVSYVWDKLIDRFIAWSDPDVSRQQGAPAPSQELMEKGLRVLASESRFRRRQLGDVLTGAMRRAAETPRLARVFYDRNQPNPAYVFLILAMSEQDTFDSYRKHRAALLTAYCRCARLQARGSTLIVGIGLDHPNKAYRGGAEDLVVWEQPEWTEADEREARDLCDRFGILSSEVEVSRSTDDEYPAAPPQWSLPGEFKLTSKRADAHADVKSRVRKVKRRKQMAKQSRRRNRQ